MRDPHYVGGEGGNAVSVVVVDVIVVVTVNVVLDNTAA